MSNILNTIEHIAPAILEYKKYLLVFVAENNVPAWLESPLNTTAKEIIGKNLQDSKNLESTVIFIIKGLKTAIEQESKINTAKNVRPILLKNSEKSFLPYSCRTETCHDEVNIWVKELTAEDNLFATANSPIASNPKWALIIGLLIADKIYHIMVLGIIGTEYFSIAFKHCLSKNLKEKKQYIFSPSTINKEELRFAKTFANTKPTTPIFGINQNEKIAVAPV